MSATTFAPTPADRAAYDLAEHPTPGGHALRVTDRPGVVLAAGAPDLIVGLAVLKPGVFNGVFEVTREDLDAWVQRFGELRGTFRPPLRIDHSWDVLSVIGRFVDLRVENRPDESAGGTIVPMLVGDVQLAGTPEENAQIKSWITSGKLDERSSEIWPYRTNTGAEYPSIFAGCAFVDIPAVEGLSPITLRRAGATLSATDAGGTPMSTTDDTTPEVAPETDAEQIPEVEPAVEDAETPEGDDADVVDEGDGTPQDEPLDTPEEGGDEPAADEPSGDLAAARPGDVEAEIERRVALRLESETRIANLSARGVLTPGVKSHAETLLRHTDDGVRSAAFAILNAQTPPVALGREAGQATSTPVPSEDGTVSPQELGELSGREFGAAWAQLTTDQRRDRAFLSVYREVRGTNPSI